MRKYILYSIKKFKIDYLRELRLYLDDVITKYEFGIHPSEWPENYDPEDPDNDEIPPTMCLSLDIFINYYANNKVYNNIETEINMIGNTKAFYEKYKGATTIIGATVIRHVDSVDYINRDLHDKELKKNKNSNIFLVFIMLDIYSFYKFSHIRFIRFNYCVK